jgi:hypothetical protein
MGALNRQLPAGAVISALADEWLILVAISHETPSHFSPLISPIALMRV